MHRPSHMQHIYKPKNENRKIMGKAVYRIWYESAHEKIGKSHDVSKPAWYRKIYQEIIGIRD